VNAPAPAKPWYSLEELAVHCGCSVEQIEALTRRHHWPRVHGEHGGKIGVDLETARRVVNNRSTAVQRSVRG
jgi:hypothetical protein